MTVIDRDVPIPDRAVFNTGSRFPFLGEMEAGDSFFGEIPDDDFWRIEANSVRAAVWRFARLRGWQFITRKVEGGIRVWRLS